MLVCIPIAPRYSVTAPLEYFDYSSESVLCVQNFEQWESLAGKLYMEAIVSLY